jgi:hypothetical protein
VAGCGSLPAAASAKSCLYTAKPVVSAVFPKSAGKAVSHIHSHDPFGILEAELGSDAQLKRISVFRREGLVAIYDIAKTRGGTKLKFTQIGIPPSRYSGHYRGWIETYWTPMKEIFATGTIGQRTKDRVKIDREQRIKTGRFRRSISNQA